MSVALARYTIIASTVFLCACGSDLASDKACFEAARAHAEAIERYRAAPEQHPIEVAARKDAVSAAIEWKKKACSNTKL